jgi:dCMP deaminase
MSERPSFESIYMGLAESMAERSTCGRLKVGAVITSPDYRKVLAVGYNGNAAGLPNCCDSDEPGNCGDLHAELNAVINCDAPRAQAKVVFVTHAPCVMCSKALINLGNVRRVFYRNEYRASGVDLLRQVGIYVVRLAGTKSSPPTLDRETPILLGYRVALRHLREMASGCRRLLRDANEEAAVTLRAEIETLCDAHAVLEDPHRSQAIHMLGSGLSLAFVNEEMARRYIDEDGGVFGSETAEELSHG